MKQFMKFLTVLAGLFLAQSVLAAGIKPFILSDIKANDMVSAVSMVKEKVTANGFEVVGEYSPYPSATIIAITSADVKATAAKTKFGIFGAAQRVTITKADPVVQVAYTNPKYMAAVYRMDGDMGTVATKMAAALGNAGEYGPENGLTDKELRDYQYKWLMPYFYDRLELNKFKTYQDAVKGVEATIAAGKGGLTKVYRVDLPEQEATVFGVGIKGNTSSTECAGDKYIMEKIDFKATKSTGHLPYEIVVKGKKVWALPAEFRIAISFPDLSMMGSNSFASIMCAPYAIQEALTLGSGGTMSDQ